MLNKVKTLLVVSLMVGTAAAYADVATQALKNTAAGEAVLSMGVELSKSVGEKKAVEQFVATYGAGLTGTNTAFLNALKSAGSFRALLDTAAKFNQVDALAVVMKNVKASEFGIKGDVLARAYSDGEAKAKLQEKVLQGMTTSAQAEGMTVEEAVSKLVTDNKLRNAKDPARYAAKFAEAVYNLRDANGGVLPINLESMCLGSKYDAAAIWNLTKIIRYTAMLVRKGMNYEAALVQGFTKELGCTVASAKDRIKGLAGEKCDTLRVNIMALDEVPATVGASN
ncbi:MAG: hypothetical protein AB7F43_09555 [Bacteriovoracia bacterium]